MRKFFLISMCLLTFGYANAQTRKVLLEEFTGAYCGQCPMGSHILDSLLGVYPDLIGVSLHTYSIPDAMFFPQIDTIGTAYSPGAPLGAVDRIFNTSWGYVAEMQNNWGAHVQARLAISPQLSVAVQPGWNSTTRSISALINVNILANMSAGDYRINLFVVEDSVTGTGSAYDQENFYNTTIGNPFYGMGNPIVGYIHRHVVRAILPYSWGKAGIISNTPTNGQNFTYSVNYTLPANYNENRIKLVAFVSAFTSNHQGDEVLNASQVNLPVSTGINEHFSSMDPIIINSNPFHENIDFSFFSIKEEALKIQLLDVMGRVVFASALSAKTGENRFELNGMQNLSSGIYFLNVISLSKIFVTKVIKD